jgi:U32 family peptidase
MTNFKVGEITHYYDKIGVAVLELTADLNIGDLIKIVKDDGEIKQEVTSMQQEHQQIKAAKKGDVVGLKVTKPVAAKSTVYRLT